MKNRLNFNASWRFLWIIRVVWGELFSKTSKTRKRIVIILTIIKCSFTSPLVWLMTHAVSLRRIIIIYEVIDFTSIFFVTFLDVLFIGDSWRKIIFHLCLLFKILIFFWQNYLRFLFCLWSFFSLFDNILVRGEHCYFQIYVKTEKFSCSDQYRSLEGYVDYQHEPSIFILADFISNKSFTLIKSKNADTSLVKKGNDHPR